MPLDDSIDSIIQGLSSEYESMLFSPGQAYLDVDNEYYFTFAVNNDVAVSGKRFEGSCLEIVFDKKLEAAVEGHYLRFQGKHRRIGYVVRRLRLDICEDDFYFSKEFDYVFAVDRSRGVVLEGNFRGRNFYIKAISLKTKFGNKMHDSLLDALKERYLDFHSFRKGATKRQVDAGRRILSVISRTRSEERFLA